MKEGGKATIKDAEMDFGYVPEEFQDYVDLSTTEVSSTTANTSSSTTKATAFSTTANTSSSTTKATAFSATEDTNSTTPILVQLKFQVLVRSAIRDSGTTTEVPSSCEATLSCFVPRVHEHWHWSCRILGTHRVVEVQTCSLALVIMAVPDPKESPNDSYPSYRSFDCLVQSRHS